MCNHMGHFLLLMAKEEKIAQKIKFRKKLRKKEYTRIKGLQFKEKINDIALLNFHAD